MMSYNIVNQFLAIVRLGIGTSNQSQITTIDWTEVKTLAT